MKVSCSSRGFKLIELVFTTGIMGVVGLVIFAILNTGMVLGAKNTAVNTAHQQARTAMLEMLQDLHSSVSLPQLVDETGVAAPTPVPGASPSPAAGIAFQMWAIKSADGSPYPPFRITAAAAAGQKNITVTPNTLIQAGQRLIVPFYSIEDDILAYNSGSGVITLKNNLPVAIGAPMVTGSVTNYAVCYVTDRCSYTVVCAPGTQDRKNDCRGTLQWKGPVSTTRNGLAKLGDSITNGNPFNIALSPGGTPDYLAVTAIDLSTADGRYSKRSFKSANILLNGQVPLRARIATHQ